jgi:tetratricopeptide (TPR) repeat protein
MKKTGYFLKWALSAALLAGALVSRPIRAEEPFDTGAIIAYLKGTYHEAQSDYYDAYQYYLYASSREPGNTRIMLRLAKVAAQVGDFERAKEHAERLLESGEHGTEARLILAEVEYRLGNNARSLEILDELRAREDAPLFEVLAFYARVAQQAGNRAEAIAALEEASAIDGTDDSVWYDLGILRAEAGEMEKAAAALGKAIERNPRHATAHLALARIHAEAGRRAEAKREYREALESDPHSGSAVKELSDMLYEDGEFVEGAALLDPFFRDGKLEEGGELVYGRFLYRAGRTDDALAVFGKLLSTMGDRPPILRVMAELETERGRFRTAFGYVKRLIAAEPGRFENYVGALVILYAPQREPASPDEAVSVDEDEKRKYLDEAAQRVAEDSAENNYLVGTILRKAGETGRAEPFLLRAEKLDPGNEGTLLELAALYSRTGRYDEALRRVVPLYNRNSDDASLANFYGYILAEKGESLDLAEKLVSKALAKDPQNGYYLDSLGWIRFKQGNSRAALDILLSAAEKAGDDPVIWEHIGDAYAELKERAKAREAYRKSLELDPKSRSAADKMKKLGDR